MTSVAKRPRLALISTVFLLPADAGGKIRTGNVLRGLKGGTFDLTLVSPAPPEGLAHWQDALAPLADKVVCWPAPPRRPRWTRVADLLRSEPANVTNGITAEARAVVERTLAEGHFDVVVFDFVHATALMPPRLGMATVCFTHNVEAEIFQRHAKQAAGALMRRVWASQAHKMLRYEHQSLARYTSVIAVSARDAAMFATQAGRGDVQTIPTAVDLDFFGWAPPAPAAPGEGPTVVFLGSMDWAANINGMAWFLADIWPRVRAAEPKAKLVVVGRNPPSSLLKQATGMAEVRFTGMVDDVRPWVRAAQVFAIPLRVGGGTRIKAFEAMAMGCPVVSTTLGVEGLDVIDGEHLLRRDAEQDQANAIVALIRDHALATRLSTQARQLVESRFGHLAAAQVFEQICLQAMQRHAATLPAPAASLVAGAAT